MTNGTSFLITWAFYTGFITFVAGGFHWLFIPIAFLIVAVVELVVSCFALIITTYMKGRK